MARRSGRSRRGLATARRLVNALPPRERESYAHRASRAGGREPGALAGLPPGTLSGSGPGELSGGRLGGRHAAPFSGRAAAAFGAARAALGLPYAWGHAGPTAFDCSGLTQWAYAHAGVAIPRTSQAQAHAGQPVPLSRPAPAIWWSTAPTPAMSRCTRATDR
ncbi:NlpC/P60 domain-containing protein OS=Streptomyces antimycoticus OX=68175 GN=SSPO_071140 PE=3 SV=1 [Streptomyces antimycoticus]